MNKLIYLLQFLNTIILVNHLYLGYNIIIILLIYIVTTFLLSMLIRYNASKF